MKRVQEVIDILKQDGINSKSIAIDLLEKMKRGEKDDSIRTR